VPRATANLSVDVFRYDDFRRFLRDFLAEAKARNSGLSQRYWIEKVGAKSQGWLADILQGRLKLSDRYLPKLISALQLKQREVEYFEALVRFNQSLTEAEKRMHLDKMLSFKELQVDLIGTDRFDFYSDWYHPALRELMLLGDAPKDPVAMAKRLNPPITAAQVRHSLELLLGLGFIAKDAQGRFRVATPLVKKDKSLPSPHLHRYLSGLMDLAKEALDRFSKQERDISCITLALSAEGLADACEEMKSLRRRLLERSAKDKKANRVYQLNLQLFPLSD
jgi:uncharacterized protein (TIGR02147 family)